LLITVLVVSKERLRGHKPPFCHQKETSWVSIARDTNPCLCEILVVSEEEVMCRHETRKGVEVTRKLSNYKNERIRKNKKEDAE
jgi:hypothetical protein